MKTYQVTITTQKGAFKVEGPALKKARSKAESIAKNAGLTYTIQQVLELKQLSEGITEVKYLQP